MGNLAIQRLTASGIAAMGLLLASNAHANGITPGTIIGVFSDVGASGEYLNSPALGEAQYVNNAGTAVYSITNSSATSVYGSPPTQTTGSSLKWGTYPAGEGVSPDEAYSELNFFGGVVPSDIHEPFQIGTITFLNGTSILSSQIFSADISFYDNTVSPSTYLGTDQIYISTTNNFYQATSQDADWINICGNGSNICNTRVEAVETYEGGTGVTADLYGSIVGDPTLAISSVAMAPGQTATGNGFIGEGRQMATSVPEPSTWAMLLAGFAGLGFAGWRARRSAAQAA
jgi:PEP-CTERM motif